MGCSVWAKHAQFSIRTILYCLLPQQGLAGEDEQQQNEWLYGHKRFVGTTIWKAFRRPFPSVRHFLLKPLPDVSPSPPVTTPLLPGAAGSFENVNAWLEPVKGLPELGTPGGICVEGSGRAHFLRPSVPLHGRLRLPREKKKCVSEAFSPGCRRCGRSGYLERLSAFADGFGASLSSVKRSDYTLNSEPRCWLAWLKSDWILKSLFFFYFGFLPKC